jgi:hypothetical protein
MVYWSVAACPPCAFFFSSVLLCWASYVSLQALDACSRSLTGPAAAEMAPGLASLVRRGECDLVGGEVHVVVCLMAGCLGCAQTM